MNPRFRLTADGQWWGARNYWINTSSADGIWRWNGAKWLASPAIEPPEALETLDPEALQANRRGRVTLGQALRILGNNLYASLRALAVPMGCLLDTLVLFVLALIWLLFVPILVLVSVGDVAFRLRVEEGPLQKWKKGRTNLLSVGKTAIDAGTLDPVPLQDGELHRIYFTRLSKTFVNYERLGAATSRIMVTG